jgi:predicted secreted protein
LAKETEVEWMMKFETVISGAKKAAFFGSVLVLAGCGAPKPQQMQLSLEANPTTGYSWTLQQDPEIFQVNDEFQENSTEDDRVGVGGQDVFTLIPEKSGKTELTFTYARPWKDPENTETKITYEVEVSKNMKIKVNGTAFAGGDDSNSLPEVPKPVIK